MRAHSRSCELVIEREGGHWRAGFKQFTVAPDVAPRRGAALLSVEATERRWALERLMWLDEDRA